MLQKGSSGVSAWGEVEVLIVRGVHITNVIRNKTMAEINRIIFLLHTSSARGIYVTLLIRQ